MWKISRCLRTEVNIITVSRAFTCGLMMDGPCRSFELIHQLHVMATLVIVSIWNMWCIPRRPYAQWYVYYIWYDIFMYIYDIRIYIYIYIYIYTHDIYIYIYIYIHDIRIYIYIYLCVYFFSMIFIYIYSSHTNVFRKNTEKHLCTGQLHKKDDTIRSRQPFIVLASVLMTIVSKVMGNN